MSTVYDDVIKTCVYVIEMCNHSIAVTHIITIHDVIKWIKYSN